MTIIRLSLAALALVSGGCNVHACYLVDRGALVSLSSLPAAEREHTLVPAVRAREKTPALLRASALPLVPAPPEVDPVPVRTTVPSKIVTAGVVLTITGSICSIVGTGVWLGTRNTGHDAVANGFGILELTGEPQMLAGTILWIYGLTRTPQEARADEPGAHVLSGADGARRAPAALLRF